MPTPTVWIILGWAAAGAVVRLAAGPVFRRLRAPVSPSVNPAAEVLTTSVLFGLLAWRLDSHLELLAFSCLTLVGVRLAVIDLTEERLPRAMTWPLYPTVLGLLGIEATVTGHHADLLRATTGMVALPAAYLALAVLTGGVGAGDVRLAGPIGLLLAWHGWTAVLTGTVLAFLYAALTALALIACRHANRRTPVPFGPAMLGGAITAALWP